MSMFTVIGQVMHVFDQPGRVDKQTGEKSPDSVKVQIMGQIPVPNGQTKVDLITLTVSEKKAYSGLLNKKIQLDLGFFAPAKNQIIYYVPKGAEPKVLSV